jgi:predicted Rossmann fold nucleotide-binding protein DprA/Smf involved in DNA uptake
VSTDDSRATVLLTTRLAAEGVEPFKARDYWALCATIGRPGLVLGADTARLGALGLDPVAAERVGALVDRATAVAFALERLGQSGIVTLTPHDPGYPDRLTDRLPGAAPPLLYAAGVTDLFGLEGVGVVGSRDVDPDGAEVARAVGATVAASGRTVVSGCARGVDTDAMTAAIESGGAVVGFPAESLTRTLRTPALRRAVLAGAAVLASPYGPDTAFSAAGAHGRNRLIFAQADHTVVVAASAGSGGTWAGATEALRAGRSVLAWQGAGAGAGTPGLVALGATPLAHVGDLP